MITVSAPGKIHLLGEHSVVYGKPAILTTVGLRVYVTIAKGKSTPQPLKKIIEPIMKKELKLKTIPPYSMTISSQIPIGCGLGSSAAVSAAYIGVLLEYLRVGWNLELISKLAYEAEKVFHGNPSGADNSTVVYGGNITIPSKLARNFVLINTGKPKESTKDMVASVKSLYDKKPKLVNKFLEDQEKLVRSLLNVIKDTNEEELIRIIREGERNLESIGVVSKYVASIIRIIEASGGAAKICGAGGKSKATGVLLCYHKDKKLVENIAKAYNLPYFSTKLGVEGVKIENDKFRKY